MVVFSQPVHADADDTFEIDLLVYAFYDGPECAVPFEQIIHPLFRELPIPMITEEKKMEGEKACRWIRLIFEPGSYKEMAVRRSAARRAEETSATLSVPAKRRSEMLIEVTSGEIRRRVVLVQDDRQVSYRGSTLIQELPHPGKLLMEKPSANLV